MCVCVCVCVCAGRPHSCMCCCCVLPFRSVDAPARPTQELEALPLALAPPRICHSLSAMETAPMPSLRRLTMSMQLSWTGHGCC